VNNGAFHAFSSEWTAYHDHLLLEKIEQCGFGNWVDTAHHVTGRSVEVLSKHFQEVFVEGKLGRHYVPSGFHSSVLEGQGGEVPPLDSDPLIAAGSADLTVLEQRELGYMPKRGDFDLEEDNEAETLLNYLMIGAAETGLEAALRFVYPEAYLLRVKERDRKKRIVQQLRLISSKHKQFGDAVNKLRSHQSTDTDNLIELLKPFARFLSHEENEQLQESVIKEQQLKSRVKELIEYRENGLTRFSATLDFKVAQQRRERLQEISARQRSHSSPVRRLSSVSSSSKRIEKAQKQDKLPIIDISHMAGFEVLSHREQQVCTTLNMMPSRYLTLKGLIVKDHVAKRRGQTVKTRYPVWLEKSHKKYIFSFLRECGWLPT
jgi:transcriptional adapter 2-beta